MAWRVAKSLLTLRDQVNAKWPNRSKLSDGFIGDTSHSSKVSDHNPNPAGVVCAFDITHDPAHGLDARKLADALLASFDPRIKYIISNSQIASSYKSGTRMPWKWGPYTGVNQHKKHVHVSVQSSPVLYDMTATWKLGAVPPIVRIVLKKGNKNKAANIELQTILKKLGFYAGKLDGGFGPMTEKGVLDFQRASNLPASGFVDAVTWDTLLKPSARPGAPVALLATVPALPLTSYPAIAMEFFQTRWEKHQAAAMVGHAIWESGGNKTNDIITAAVGDAGHSHGAFQWNDTPAGGERFQALKAFAAKSGLDYRDLRTQLAFTEYELVTTEKRTGALLHKATNVEEAVKAFMGYERPSGFSWENPEKGHGYAQRLKLAKALM